MNSSMEKKKRTMQPDAQTVQNEMPEGNRQQTGTAQRNREERREPSPARCFPANGTAANVTAATGTASHWIPALWSPLLYIPVTLAVFLLCVCVGSVAVPLPKTLAILGQAMGIGGGEISSATKSIILAVRLPRVLCVALSGASLALCGAAMQGLLKNPLADGSTLGVSSGASLGAVIAIAFGLSVPGVPLAGTMVFAMLSAFLFLLFILSLAYHLDHSLSTHTIILIGIIASMFANSVISLIVTFASDKVKSITFWTMGSLAGSSLENAGILGFALMICGIIVFGCARELDAFAIGEENARSIGVDARRIRLMILISVSALIGVCVSIGGSIGFVGLVIPHVARMLTGPAHRRLLPASMFLGAVFLMLSDLTARVILNPRELPVGVVTSFIGAPVFIFIFYRTRK